eukprot:gnl/MRDRNA2_/MRDRNA2_27925_c0_seq1.p1 gnl/MRDRNA2_/MRDRNA2_27925_c0~~gnl/MRDRNA2_/MRDRNA2_27925_c0_seq1.p1  ORF type:complete len:365 (-),score=62.97 gnl/MRDRNA2_/MRDRNA2_27925_c0_seq1:30-1124(-)
MVLLTCHIPCDDYLSTGQHLSPSNHDIHQAEPQVRRCVRAHALGFLDAQDLVSRHDRFAKHAKEFLPPSLAAHDSSVSSATRGHHLERAKELQPRIVALQGLSSTHGSTGESTKELFPPRRKSQLASGKHVDMHLKPSCNLGAAAATGIGAVAVGKVIVAERGASKKAAEEDLNIFGNHLQPCVGKSHCGKDEGVCVFGKRGGGKCMDADDVKQLLANDDRIRCASTSCHVVEDASPEALQLITERCAGKLRDCHKTVVATTATESERRQSAEQNNLSYLCRTGEKTEGCPGQNAGGNFNGPIPDKESTEPNQTAPSSVDEHPVDADSIQAVNPGSMQWPACLVPFLVQKERSERARRRCNAFL